MKKSVLFAAASVLLSLTSLFVNAQYTNLHNFSGAPDGSEPLGDLYSDGTWLYGTTHSGGENSLGTIFKLMLDGTGYERVFNFSNAAGAHPNESLTSDATYLYGTTFLGGTDDFGTLYRILKDGTAFETLLDFGSATTGRNPVGTPIFDGTWLYGVTRGGGANSNGTIYTIKPDGSEYEMIFEFSGSNGFDSYGSLFYDGTWLYGMTRGGGTGPCTPSFCGVIYRLMPDGSNFTILHDFMGTDGNGPEGELISDGTFLYGMTTHGGTHDWGTIFKIMPDGSGFEKLHDFDVTSSNGALPTGSLVYDGIWLYGSSLWGGTESIGALFKIMPTGTNFTLLYSFTNESGFYPQGSPIINGTYLYGTTTVGGSGCPNDHGPSGCGVVLRYQYDSIIGIAEHEGRFFISPNPSPGLFTLTLPNTTATICIYDVVGNCILTQQYIHTTPQIDLSTQSKGIYFVEVITAGERAVRKVVVN